MDCQLGRGKKSLMPPPVASPGPLFHVVSPEASSLVPPHPLTNGLVEGKSLTDYRKEAGISINTTKFHLRSLFAKTETHSQVGLVRLALIALRGL